MNYILTILITIFSYFQLQMSSRKYPEKWNIIKIGKISQQLNIILS